ncbi:MAG: PSD1 domain-containing protein [Acidobacteria bacterium]|nr:PSD1 domain-containing protein [Acidobacteriota bacterium]
MQRALVLLVASLASAADDTDFFEKKVRPVFAANCYTCHTQTQMGGLRLDTRDALTKGGKSGNVIVPGKPDDSLLIQAVRRTHAKLKMPPATSLAAGDVAVLEEWVKRGAVWPESASGSVVKKDFWSFRPLQTAEPPKVKRAEWAKTPVDRYVLAQLEARGIAPNAAADRNTLIRRVTLDVTGLPPTPEEVDAFVADRSPDAFAKVVDRLLASQHYGERWGRYWLDLARYSDGQLAAGVDTPLPNAWRYRDWVVQALNTDLPYDQFVKAQIAADLLPVADRDRLLPGLGFQALAASASDQVDVTTKVFLGLTVGCAQCHDHKYDPIPTRDYYSLLGIFRSTKMDKAPLVAAAEVKAYEDQKAKIDAVKERIADFLVDQQKLLVDALARNTARYMVAAWKTNRGEAADTAGLDAGTLKRWVTYLNARDKEHPYLKGWYELMARNPTEEQVRAEAVGYQKFVFQLLDEAKEVEDKNYVAFGGRKGQKDERTRQYTNIVSLPVLKFYQWRELASGPYNIDGFRAPAGIYYYGPKEIDRWMSGFAKDYLESLRAEQKTLESALPKQYAYLHAVADNAKPADVKVMIRGDAKTLGDVAPRQFLTALCDGKQERYTKGSGRLQFAEDVVNHPLAARVMVNRIWQHHFRHGIVRSPSNFGQMGERPTHPELLDYLARRFRESGYSVKTIHREILLSNTYALSAASNKAAEKTDPDNRLLWRANVQPRLDWEALRDSVLAVSGKLDRTAGGAPKPWSDTNHARSLYLTVSRTRLDATMSLFDFPDPNGTAEERPVTIGPLQGLFFLNSKFVSARAADLVARLEKERGNDTAARISGAYQLLYARKPDPAELRLGIEYVSSGASAWHSYVLTLLGSAEFTSVP